MSANPSCSTTSGAGGGGGGSSGSSGGGSGSGSGPCGACKFLRRKCVAGCVFAPYFDSEEGAAHFAAVHKVVNLRTELSYIQAHLTTLELPTPPSALPPQPLLTTPPLSISDLPAPSCMPATYDLSSLFDPPMVGGGGDLQELARELLQRHDGSPPQPSTDASALPPHSR